MNTMRNKVQLIGHLGARPEIKIIEGGKKLAKINLATNETYSNAKGEKVEETQWHSIIAWGKTAEIAEKYFNKGQQVIIEGKLVNRNYEDKEGNKKYVTEIHAYDLMVLSKK
ncbi:single-stranded DNA-binding protein [Segetibacter sp. 3557_3]|uniref:single-stranded DNA-binding protein n=1 Tax=Segetibacter sp. 3557_3 TaxID=2547429 RepID=UPI0010590E1C|nr:single-stranded DNA-binding protein [Segetibacter sp. 3557_3]TDH25270.1 single-stranded DNA-binding protein [Segetibacter sp. 3557_3]